MQAFFRTPSSVPREPASSSAKRSESSAPSNVETFTIIEAVSLWLKSQVEASTAPDLQRLRAATEVLTRKPKPRQEDVFPLCSSWNVRQREHKKPRPLTNLITELQQAVITEGNQLRRSLDALTGASASSAAQPAEPAAEADTEAGVQAAAPRANSPKEGETEPRRARRRSSSSSSTSSAPPPPSSLVVASAGGEDAPARWSLFIDS